MFAKELSGTLCVRCLCIHLGLALAGEPPPPAGILLDDAELFELLERRSDQTTGRLRRVGWFHPAALPATVDFAELSCSDSTANVNLAGDGGYSVDRTIRKTQEEQASQNLDLHGLICARDLAPSQVPSEKDTNRSLKPQVRGPHAVRNPAELEQQPGRGELVQYAT
jgi:hypothetical protein